jgi:hypothetical protein
MMHKSRFTFSDDNVEFEGYTDGSLWNGWSNVIFTREQIKALFDTLPYEYYFTDANWEEDVYPLLVVKWNNEEEIFESSPICIQYDDGTNEVDILEGFHLHGIEFMEVAK